MNEGRYMDVVTAAAYTSLSVFYLRRLTSRKRVPFIRIGRRCVYDRTLLDRWMARRQILPAGWTAGDGT